MTVPFVGDGWQTRASHGTRLAGREVRRDAPAPETFAGTPHRGGVRARANREEYRAKMAQAVC
jgi:hypothetical protein